jgi:flagellar basal body rod protein FlgB
MDRELSSMSKNALAFQTYSQLMASKIGAYRTAISGRS